jgi:hypothetical protein
MRRTGLALITFALVQCCCHTLAAQQDLLPADVGDRLALFVGTWDGKRTVSDSTGPRMESAISFIAYRVLGNTAIQLRNADAGGGAAGGEDMLQLFAWDNELKRMVAFSTNSLASSSYMEGDWAEDGSPILHMRGRKVLDRVTVEIDETWSFPDANHIVRNGTITLRRPGGLSVLTVVARLQRRK